MRFSISIAIYILRSVVPYFAAAWLLLSVVLFVQQAGRFSDIFFSANIPGEFVWQLTFSLVPSVISFTCPMAVLVGVLIGLNKMASDNELVAIRAAGTGSLQVLLPLIIFGLILSAFSFFVNLKGVPFAARIVRQVATQTAIYKLESPIEPGIFNTEVAGYTIYIKDGDIEKGTWKKIFVYTKDEITGKTRLITSTNGRIDSSDDRSELVLENAVSAELSKTESGDKFVSENIGEIRYSIKTRRGDLIEKLGSAEMTPDELGLQELSEYARVREGKDRIEALIVWQRRLVLSVTPLIFAILSGIIALRFWRRGRGFAFGAALASLIGYYLVSFLGEQLVRTGQINEFASALFPAVFSIAAIAAFTMTPRFRFLSGWNQTLKDTVKKLRLPKPKARIEDIFVDLTTGLRDFDLLFNLAKYYAAALVFLTAVFLIFTGFEMWRFAGSFAGGGPLLLQYLFYLQPFVYLQLSPSAVMVAVLATYVIKSRQNEIVTWTAAGQSIYRILLPCFGAAVLVGIFNFGVQELIAPAANVRQDELRTMLRSRGIVGDRGKLWVADETRIFSFSLDKDASDNATRVNDLQIFEFDKDGTRLKAMYRAPSATWKADRLMFDSGLEEYQISESGVSLKRQAEGELLQANNPFVQANRKPSHLTVSEIRERIDASESEVERRTLAVALDKRYTTLVIPFVIALFTAPFAMSIRQKGKVVMVGYAVGLWLAFMGISGVFEQLGSGGSLQSGIAVWGPLAIFAMAGVVLLSKTKT